MFDISKFYNADDTRDLLVRNPALGAALASYFSKSRANTEDNHLSHNTVLMRGHGFTTVGSSIEECVLRAIYTSENAAIQTASLSINMAHSLGSGTVNDIQYLREDELKGTTNMTKWSCMRPWNLWIREIESIGLYVNKAE